MAEAKKSSKKKRLVKNPETFRQKVVKAAEGNDRPSRKENATSLVKQFFVIIFRPLAKLLKKVGSLKIFRPLKKPLNILGKIIFPVYVRNSFKELKYVTWPTWRESIRLTVAVLIFAVIFAAIVAALDYGLDKLFRGILLK